MSRTIEQAVRSKYGAVAESDLSSNHAGVRAVAEAFGYTPEELASIPAEANMGLSCGNPTATARLRPGEVVVDLGCGGGLDVFLAAAKVYTDQQDAILASSLAEVRRRAYAGSAVALAAGGIPQAFTPVKAMLGVGVGSWEGESGLAVGGSALFANGKTLVKAAASFDTRGDVGVSAGIGFQF